MTIEQLDAAFVDAVYSVHNRTGDKVDWLELCDLMDQSALIKGMELCIARDPTAQNIQGLLVIGIVTGLRFAEILAKEKAA